MQSHSPRNPRLFPVSQAVGSISSPENIDEDCNTISRLILSVENAIGQYLFDELEEGLIDLSETEAFQDYCCPRIGGWLKDMKKMYS